MAIWEQKSSGSISRSPVTVKALPTNNSSYGSTYVYDLASPDRTVTLDGTGLSGTEKANLETAAMTRNAVLTVTDSAGVSHTGRLMSVSWETIPGTNLYNATMVLSDQSFEANTNLTQTVTPFTSS